jgi:Arc/MetJ family transcription regulator
VPTNVNVDAELVDQTVALGGHTSEAEAVNAALREYVAERRRVTAVEGLLGTVEFDPEYDYKKARRDR